MGKYFPQQKSLGGVVKAEFDLSNYATKADLKNATGVDSSKFSIKVDLASLKSNVKIKYIEDKIPDITNLATNTTLNGKINEVKSKISSIINLATTTSLDAKINEFKNKIPNITNLATTTTAVTAVENEIPNVSNLVKKNLTMTQKLVKLKVKLLLMVILINI